MCGGRWCPGLALRILEHWLYCVAFLIKSLLQDFTSAGSIMEEAKLSEAPGELKY